MTRLAIPERHPVPLRQDTGIRTPKDAPVQLRNPALTSRRLPPGLDRPPPRGHARYRPAPTGSNRSAPRARILAQLDKTPGIHLRALRRSLDIEMSTLVHHLRVLGHQGLAGSHSFGRFKAFYPIEGVDRRDWEIIFFLRQDKPGRILQVLSDEHAAGYTRIAAELGVAPTTCHFHLMTLYQAGLLEREQAGTHVLWSLREPRHVGDLIRRYPAA